MRPMRPPPHTATRRESIPKCATDVCTGITDAGLAHLRGWGRRLPAAASGRWQHRDGASAAGASAPAGPRMSAASAEEGVPLHLLCHHYLRGADCSPPARCTGQHAPKPARAPCAAWLQSLGTPCPFGASCWFPHALPPSLCVPRPARGAVQVPASHADRAEAFLRAQLPPGVAVARAREHGAGKRAHVLLLLCVEEGGAEFDVRAALGALLAFPFLAPALVRIFVLRRRRCAQLGGAHGAAARRAAAAAAARGRCPAALLSPRP